MQTVNSLALIGEYVVIDGQLMLEAESRFSVASSPLLYGLAAYTVLPVTYRDGDYLAFRLQDHVARLRNSAKIIGMELSETVLSTEDFKVDLGKMLRANHTRQDVLLRATVATKGLVAGTRLQGLPTSLSMYAYAGPRFHPASGIHVCVSSWRRTPDNCIPSRAKINGSYVNATLMKNQALLEGYDDAIALDTDGHVAESTVANIFIVRGGRLITPSASADILEGITRDTVICWARSQGIEIIERQVDRTELYIADEVFITGTSAKITPILTIDKRSIGTGRVGRLTRTIQRMYDRLLTGEVTLDSSWLSMV